MIVLLSYSINSSSKVYMPFTGWLEYDSILAEQARQRYILLDRSCKKVTKQRNVAYCSAAGAIILLILSLIK